MLLHGVEEPNIKYRESLSDEVSDIENRYTLILANPPFSGSLDYEATSQKLQRVVKTKKTELLFLALFLQLLNLEVEPRLLFLMVFVLVLQKLIKS